jgi:hypothetical protein
VIDEPGDVDALPSKVHPSAVQVGVKAAAGPGATVICPEYEALVPSEFVTVSVTE